MRIEEQIAELATPILAERNAFVIDVTVRGERGSPVAELFIDTDEGVTTELCEGVSRELSRALDSRDLFRGRYYLVVSSPGIERPLKLPRQYPRNVGRRLSMKLKQGNGVEHVRGTLVEAAGEEILLEISAENHRRIQFVDIVEARVEAPW